MKKALLITEDGNVHGVYNDELAKMGLGDPIIRRATGVEYNHGQGQWEATDLRSGKLIATGTERDKVIKEEVRLLNEQLADPSRNEPLQFHCHSGHPSSVQAVQPT